MLNQYPAWKYLLIMVVIVVGLLYALPNIYGTVPALQVTAETNIKVDAAVQQKVEAALKTAEIPVSGLTLENNQILLRFGDVEDQLKATDVVKQALGESFYVAQNLVSASPSWLSSLNAEPMYLGLDLRGGLYFLMEVDTSKVLKNQVETLANDFRSTLREKKIDYKTIRDDGTNVTVRFVDAQVRDQAESRLKKEFSGLLFSGYEADNSYFLVANYTDPELENIYRNAIKQNIATLRKRVNELGVAEPIIQQQGLNRIVIQLPGIQDSNRAKRLLQSTASLEFRLVDMDADIAAALEGRVPARSRLYYTSQRVTGEQRPVVLQKRIVLTGDHIDNASADFDDNGRPAVSIRLDAAGGNVMERVTQKHLDKDMAIVFIEHKAVERIVDGEKQIDSEEIQEVINTATIRGVFSRRFQIYGLSNVEESRNLALLLRTGALKAPVRIIEERTIGPSLGKESIEQGRNSVIIGLILVVIFMVIYYRSFGVVANIALATNLVLIVALLSMFQATLTLPGIAGIVLTIGMAVDANVLIFERIREELSIGNTPQRSIASGYEKALSTIADANITTLIAAVLLFVFGTGPIKGFAITLSFGIATSMFTAIMGTRAIINLFVGKRKLTKLSL